MHTRFDCPACKQTDTGWSIAENCRNCGFSPHFIKCPHCNTDFSLVNLLGDFRDGEGHPTTPEPKRHYEDKYSYIVRDFRVQYYKKSFDLDLFLRKVSIEESDAFMETRFGFPFPIGRIAIHTVSVSDDKGRWLHVWVYSEKEGGEPFGQLSFVCPRSDIGNAEHGQWQCVTKEVFFPPT
jgi:hypothetical protein